MSHPHPLNLPEITSLISTYLTPQSLLSCIQVSSSFHLAFAPQLWSSITLKPPTLPKHCFRIPSKQALARYQHHIRDLRLLNLFPGHYLTAFEDRLQGLCINTLSYRRYDPRYHAANLRRLLMTVRMNAGSLRCLSIITPLSEKESPKEVQEVLREVWEVIMECQGLRSLEVGFLMVTMGNLKLFWEVCGGDVKALSSYLASADDSGTVTETDDSSDATEAAPSSRTVKLGKCTLDEWPDEVYADESLILPAVISIDFLAQVFQPNRFPLMSIYGQARMIRKCVNLKSFTWRCGDFRMDIARTQRWNVQSGSEIDWFFGGLLGDTPEGPGKQWKARDGDIEEEREEEGDRWPLPCLESIETPWMNVPDVTIARLLKRLHRLKNLRLISPTFGPLAFQELVRERTPFRSAISPHHPPLPRRLCDHVVTLDMFSYKFLSSDNILELLESCPMVETFQAGLVNMSGVIKRPDWACTRVKVLTIEILFDQPQDAASTRVDEATDHATDHAIVTIATSPTVTDTVEATTAITAADVTTEQQQRAVFTQLSRLHHVSSFNTTSFEPSPDLIELQLKLDYGLDLLTTWSNSITCVRFGCRGSQDMTLADMQWVLDHWPHVKAMICQNFSPNEDVQSQIRDALKAKEVSAVHNLSNLSS